LSLNEELRREITELASRATDGGLNEQGQKRLEELLKGSTEARAFYVRFMGISAGLAWAARGGAAGSETMAVLRPRSWHFKWRQVSAAAVVVLAALGVWFSLHRPPKGTPPDQEPGVATLSTAENIEWEESQEPHHRGNVLLPGWMRIKSGLAQIDFFSGTSVWIEGPAAFHLVSPRRGYLEAGKLVAQVPHGTVRGFQVDTPLATIIDQGTAFGVEVKAGQAAVHVFAGIVEVTPKDGTPVSYFAGQAAQLDEAGGVRPMFCDPRLFDYGGFGWGFNSFGVLGAWPGQGSYYGPARPWYPVWGPQVWRGWDPQEFIRAQLGVDGARWEQMQPILAAYLGAQWELDRLGYVPPDSTFSRAAWDLWLGTLNPQATDEDLDKRLAAYRESRAEMRQKRDQAEKDLQELLTVREEGILLDMGYLR
jgi:hypothetical protein